MEYSNEDIIDLTSLDYHFPCNNNNNPVVICEEIIDLVDESFDGEKRRCRLKNKINKTKSPKVQKNKKKSNEIDNEENSGKAGCCSICWEKLGNNPLASTKCGHVYCLMCLERSLKCDKRCPTCRRILKGASAYHPLYLDLG